MVLRRSKKAASTYLEGIRSRIVFVGFDKLAEERSQELGRLRYRCHRCRGLGDLRLDHLERRLPQLCISIAEPLDAEHKLLLQSLIFFILKQREQN